MSLLHTPSARRGAGLALTLLLLSWAPLPLLAECTALDQYGMTRDCTFTERLGKCLSEAYDSRDDCLRRATGVFGWLGCHTAFGLDQTACLIGSPLEHILARLE